MELFLLVVNKLYNGVKKLKLNIYKLLKNEKNNEITSNLNTEMFKLKNVLNKKCLHFFIIYVNLNLNLILILIKITLTGGIYETYYI